MVLEGSRNIQGEKGTDLLVVSRERGLGVRAWNAVHIQVWIRGAGGEAHASF